MNEASEDMALMSLEADAQSNEAAAIGAAAELEDASWARLGTTAAVNAPATSRAAMIEICFFM